MLGICASHVFLPEAVRIEFGAAAWVRGAIGMVLASQRRLGHSTTTNYMDMNVFSGVKLNQRNLNDTMQDIGSCWTVSAIAPIAKWPWLIAQTFTQTCFMCLMFAASGQNPSLGHGSSFFEWLWQRNHTTCKYLPAKAAEIQFQYQLPRLKSQNGQHLIYIELQMVSCLGLEVLGRISLCHGLGSDVPKIWQASPVQLVQIHAHTCFKTAS